MNKAPVAYMERTRLYYQAQGFDKPYVWAHNDEIPFSPLNKPLELCSVAIVTTAVFDPGVIKTMRSVKSIAVEEAPDAFHTMDLAWDKEATHTDDSESYFPLQTLTRLADESVIGEVSKRFHCVPTEYTQRQTLENDGPAILDACRKDEVDVAILVPL